MTFFRGIRLAAGLFACLSLTAPAVADVTVSHSNNPAITPTLTPEAPALPAWLGGKARRRAPVPVVPVYARSWVDGLPEATGGPQWACLTEALYFEARGESVRGQFAVAEVILNRVDSPRFPATVCGVVNQGTGKRFQCQFTYTCDGRAERIREPKAHARAGKIARLMLDGAQRTLTEGATHYHTRAVNPRWARQFPRTASIGLHHFYRMPGARI